MVEAASFEIFVHCEVGQGFVLTAELTGELWGVSRLRLQHDRCDTPPALVPFRHAATRAVGWCGWFAHREEVHHGGLLRLIAVPVGWG